MKITEKDTKIMKSLNESGVSFSTIANAFGCD